MGKLENCVQENHIREIFARQKLVAPIILYPRSVKWDFEDNLIPVSCPSFEEETYRILPYMRGKLHGMCVYVPTPEVSMFDLTIQLDKESETIYRDVCLKVLFLKNTVL